MRLSLVNLKHLYFSFSERHYLFLIQAQVVVLFYFLYAFGPTGSLQQETFVRGVEAEVAVYHCYAHDSHWNEMVNVLPWV